jgi:hypothetical protein
MLECVCFKCGKTYGLSLDDFGEGDDSKSCFCESCKRKVSTTMRQTYAGAGFGAGESTNSAQEVSGQGVNAK